MPPMKAETRPRAPAIVFFALGLTALPLTVLVGCKSGPASICDLRCECEGCSRKQYTDCVDNVEDAMPVAEDDGCSSQFDAYISCYGDTGACENDVFIAEDCRDEGDALKSCTPAGGTFIKTICQDASAKRQNCGFGSGGFGADCTGTDACVAACTLSATCNEINNSVPGAPFNNCVNACTSSP
jgi:hypothetical protein